MNVLKKIEQIVENHQCKKCEKCPCYWADGYIPEEGCYIDEGRACKALFKLFTKLSFFDDFSGCFIPLFIIKMVYKFECWRIRRKYRKEQLGE